MKWSGEQELKIFCIIGTIRSKDKCCRTHTWCCRRHTLPNQPKIWVLRANSVTTESGRKILCEQHHQSFTCYCWQFTFQSRCCFIIDKFPIVPFSYSIITTSTAGKRFDWTTNESRVEQLSRNNITQHNKPIIAHKTVHIESCFKGCLVVECHQVLPVGLSFSRKINSSAIFSEFKPDSSNQRKFYKFLSHT